MRLEPRNQKNRDVLSCQRVECLFGKDCGLGVVLLAFDEMLHPISFDILKIHLFCCIL